ncbi:MAG: hypothetical protein EBR27_13115 [Betaproteobacteria bacterium]|nr:hypothetical protein [Betaproteobacteria bacterium]
MSRGVKTRTQYVKLSLTPSEYDALSKFSENMDKPIAFCIRMIMQRMSDFADLYDIISKAYNSATEEERNLLAESLASMNEIDRLQMLAFHSDMKAIIDFNNLWKKTSIQTLFSD